MSNDGMLRLYKQTENESFSEQANLAFGRNLQESMCLTLIGQNNFLLFVGGYDSKIHVYTLKLDSNQFIYRFSMTGHFNSIKTLAVSNVLQGEIIYLASGSQD
jgi:WD40 repeat protein